MLLLRPSSDKETTLIYLRVGVWMLLRPRLRTGLSRFLMNWRSSGRINIRLSLLLQPAACRLPEKESDCRSFPASIEAIIKQTRKRAYPKEIDPCPLKSAGLMHGLATKSGCAIFVHGVFQFRAGINPGHRYHHTGENSP
jgi:hypothetical protein